MWRLAQAINSDALGLALSLSQTPVSFPLLLYFPFKLQKQRVQTETLVPHPLPKGYKQTSTWQQLLSLCQPNHVSASDRILSCLLDISHLQVAQARWHACSVGPQMSGTSSAEDEGFQVETGNIGGKKKRVSEKRRLGLTESEVTEGLAPSRRWMCFSHFYFSSTRYDSWHKVKVRVSINT